MLGEQDAAVAKQLVAMQVLDDWLNQMMKSETVFVIVAMSLARLETADGLLPGVSQEMTLSREWRRVKKVRRTATSCSLSSSGGRESSISAG